MERTDTTASGKERAAGRREWTFILIDLAGFTALTEAHGDDRAADLAVGFAELAEAQLGPGDRLVKCIGDAVLLASPDPVQGLSLTRRIMAACTELDGFPVARAGLHHGSAVERGGDMFGAAVNLTARIAAQAAGGQVLASGAVVQADHEEELEARLLGEFELKNVSEPIALYEIAMIDHAATVDPVCRMQVHPRQAQGPLRLDSTEYWFCSLECAAVFASSPDRFRS